jgi:brefeldin A-resistance guanine nucleotide exchange factor 1
MLAPQMVVNSSGHIVYSEILSVTSIMRKHSRWSSSTQNFHTRDSAHTSLNHLGSRRPETSGTAGLQQGSREEVFMSGFEQLKRTLRSTQGTRCTSGARALLNVLYLRLSSDVSSIPLTDILSPFLSIIRSPLSLSPVTSAALSAIHTFFARGLVLLDDPSIDVALAEISSAVSHCTFEASDSSDEEVVFLRILAVIEDCMCGSWTHRLGDIEVYEMLETVLAICVQMRLSGQFSPRPFVRVLFVLTGP